MYNLTNFSLEAFKQLFFFQFLFFNFCCFSVCCHCCYWLLQLVFLCSFSCIHQVLVLMHQHNPQYWWNLFLLLFLTYIVYVIFCLMYCHQFLCLLVYLSEFFPLMRFLQRSLFSRGFLVLLRNFFLIFFLHLCLFDGVCIQYSQVLVIFFPYKHTDIFLIWLLYSFHCFFIPASYYQHGTFFKAKFHSYICKFFCLYQCLQFFFIFCKYLNIIYVIIIMSCHQHRYP